MIVGAKLLSLFALPSSECVGTCKNTCTTFRATIMGQLFSKPEAPTITLVGIAESCEGLDSGTCICIRWHRDTWPKRFSMAWEEDIEGSRTVEFEDISGLLLLLSNRLNAELAHQEFKLDSNFGFGSDRVYGAADKEEAAKQHRPVRSVGRVMH